MTKEDISLHLSALMYAVAANDNAGSTYARESKDSTQQVLTKE